MLTIANNLITREEFDVLIDTVATKPEFKGCFAIRGCDLSLNHWWAAYIRQSLDEQSRNNRIPEYLLSCAKIAKDLGVLVPRNISYTTMIQASTWRDLKWSTFERL